PWLYSTAGNGPGPLGVNSHPCSARSLLTKLTSCGPVVVDARGAGAFADASTAGAAASEAFSWARAAAGARTSRPNTTTALVRLAIGRADMGRYYTPAVTGTWINVATVLIGGTLGLLFGSRFPDKMRQT